MNISSKRFILITNTKRLKVLSAHNICNRSQLTNHLLNQRPSADKNKVFKFLLNDKCRFKPSLTLNMTLTTQSLDESTYERIADQTLEHLYEEFETLVETNGELKDSDVSLNNGVITWNLGLHGVYVINKQKPNKQIWFSSPISGPKRYDYINKDWIYKRDGTSLINTLSSELSQILKREINIKTLNI